MSPDRRFQNLRKVVPTVSRETVDKLIAFEDLFRKWSKAINLASPSTLDDLWNRHIVDSAQIFPLAPNATRWLDIGSGGGFPGIVTGCFLNEVPDASIDLVESVGKKSAFLRTVSGNINIPARVHSARIEAMWEKIQTPQVITARALASLNVLFELTEPWMRDGCKALFQKGRDYQREIDESRVGWSFDLVQHVSAIDKSSVILEISNLRRISS